MTSLGEGGTEQLAPWSTLKLAQVVSRVRKKVEAHVRRHCGASLIPEEVVAEAVCRLFETHATTPLHFCSEVKLKGWLKRAALFVILEELRDPWTKGRVTLESSEAETDELEQLVNRYSSVRVPTAEEELIAWETLEQLTKLSPRAKEELTKVVQDLSTTKLSASERGRRHRSRKHARRLLRKE